jgi:hypothetical protein
LKPPFRLGNVFGSSCPVTDLAGARK